MKSQTQIFSFNFLVLLALTFFTSLNQSQAQSGGTLEVGQNKVFTVDKDTLILDAIVIGDSAKIILAKPTTYFKANQMIIGSGSQIIGIGAKGENGKVGKSFTTALGICKSGVNGEAGGQGIDGGAGKNLVIEVAQLTIKSTLTIELTGGNGGDGGKGGKGSHGGGTTVHCTANGGNGGSGGNGGNGGIGGTFSLIVQTPAKADLTSKINLINRGGYRGIGGDGGQGGHRGTGPSERKSSIGLAGKIGADGKYGQDGRLLFYSIFKPGEISATTTARSVSGK